MDSLKALSASWLSDGRFSYDEHTLSKPSSDELVIDLSATTVNPIDVRRLGGYGRRIFGLLGATRYPLTLGNDIVGIVSGAPSRGIFGLKEGDRVFGCKPPSSQGAHATKVVVKAKYVRHAPKGVEDEALAALPYNMFTVLSAIDSLNLPRAHLKEKSVLIYGAAGGLGVLATQLLVQWGAKVTAVARSARHEICRTAGAHHVCEASQIQGQPDRFDVTMNFAAWEVDELVRAKLSPAGIGHATTVHPLMSIIDSLGFIRGAFAIANAKRAMKRSLPPGLKASWVVLKPKPDDLDWIGDLAARNVLRAVIGMRASLAETPLAFDHVAKSGSGRAILTP